MTENNIKNNNNYGIQLTSRRTDGGKKEEEQINIFLDQLKMRKDEKMGKWNIILLFEDKSSSSKEKGKTKKNIDQRRSQHSCYRSKIDSTENLFQWYIRI